MPLVTTSCSITRNLIYTALSSGGKIDYNKNLDSHLYNAKSCQKFQKLNVEN